MEEYAERIAAELTRGAGPAGWVAGLRTLGLTHDQIAEACRTDASVIVNAQMGGALPAVPGRSNLDALRCYGLQALEHFDGDYVKAGTYLLRNRVHVLIGEARHEEVRVIMGFAGDPAPARA